MDSKKDPEEKKASQELPQAKENVEELFLKEYEALCKKYNLNFSVNPTWVSTNHGSFELVLQMGITKLS